MLNHYTVFASSDSGLISKIKKNKIKGNLYFSVANLKSILEMEESCLEIEQISHIKSHKYFYPQIHTIMKISHNGLLNFSMYLFMFTIKNVIGMLCVF